MSNEEYNKNLCKSIANEIKAYCDGRMYRCPVCNAVFEWNEDNYDADEHDYTCNSCGEAYDADDLEARSIWDYLSKNCYDVEYRIDGRGNYKSVEITVAVGGPNICIDTADDRVKLCWWHEKADCSFLPDVGNAIDDYYEQEYLTLKEY